MKPHPRALSAASHFFLHAAPAKNPTLTPAENGQLRPNVGVYRVEIRWPKATGKKIVESDSGAEIDEMKEAIPLKFNEKTELTIEIKKGLNEKSWEFTP